MLRTIPYVLFSLACVQASDPVRETTPFPKPKVEIVTAKNGSAETAVQLEWTNPEKIRTNVPNAFQLTVRNHGKQPAHHVVVQTRLPEGVTVTGVVPEAKTDRGVLLWDFGTLDGLQTRTIQFQLTTTVKRDLACQAWVTVSGQANTSVAVREPKLALTLESEPNVVLGDVIRVKAVCRNTGDDDGTHPTLTFKHKEMTHQRGFAGLPVGQSVSEQSTWIASTPGKQTIDATFEIDGGIKVTEKVTVNVLVPKLNVAIAGPTVRQIGRKATYTVTVTNGGEVPLKDVSVNETFPNEFRLESSSLAFAKSNATATWVVGELIPGQSKVFTYEASAVCPGPATHQIKAIGSRNTAAMAEAKTVVEGIPALRMEMVDHDDPIEKNGQTTYEIRLTNTGTKADNFVTLECQLPPELKLISASGPTAFKETPTGLRFDAVSTLAPKTEALYKVKVKAVGSGDVRFHASATTSSLTKPVVKTESTRVYGD